MTDYPVIHNCNLSTREDETGRLVWQAVTMADAGKLDCHDRDEQRVLDCLETLEETLEEFAEDDSAEAGNTCRAAEEAVAKALRETRVWFLDAFAGERLDAPATVDAMERCDWIGYYPVIDADVRLTGEFVYADEEGRRHANYDNQAMINRADAVAAGWTIDGDGFATPPAGAIPQVEVIVGHRSSIAGARWCRPIGWSPRNRVEGADWSDEDGAWLTEEGEAAGIVVFTEDEEGEKVTVGLDDLRVASSGDCRVAGNVVVDFA